MELNDVLRPLADDLPREVRAFAQFLRTLMASLGTQASWYSAQALRDPHAMERYLDGVSVPPRDVLATLIRDLAVHRGVQLTPEAERQARELHAAAVRSIDDAPGRVEELQAELHAMKAEHARALDRERDLVAGVRARQSELREGAASHSEYRRRLITIHDELTRARELRARTQARVEELTERLAAARRHAGADGRSQAQRPAARPTGARFAGAFTETPLPGPLPAPAPQPQAPVPAPPPNEQPAAPPAVPPQPTGARFAGAQSGRRRAARKPENRHRATPAPQAQPQPDYREYPPARELAQTLAQLRTAGHLQESQALLWEAAAWPPERFPSLLAALAETEQTGDAAMLLWELSSRAPQELAAFTVWLVKAGRERDWRELLSHASSRPHEAVAGTVAALAGAGWHEQVSVLLGSVVRSRPPDEIADLARDLAAHDAERALRELLATAKAGPRDRHLQIGAALRLAGLPEDADDLSAWQSAVARR